MKMSKMKGNGAQQDAVATSPGEVRIDLFRAFIFPNRVREQRRANGYQKLLRLSANIPEIPYIRLSKIERGEVVPRPDELRRIASQLGVAPDALLLDIDAPGFDIASWADPFIDGEAANLQEERFAVLLGAAVRARRTGDPALTISTIERDFHLAPVNLSRIENAQKTFPRWNGATQAALYALFGVGSEGALRRIVEERYRSGGLDGFLDGVSDPVARHERSRARIADMASALADAPEAPRVVAARPPAGPMSSVRLISVRGGALAKGLIADTLTGESVQAPHGAGPRAFGLKVARATLGAGLPAQATVIVDPDRPPSPGGLAVLREAEGWRLLSVGSDRNGSTIGYSQNPELEIPLDDCDPATLATVIASLFV
jgi:transcriptional regulator with XRE-family HTH domain